MRALHTRQRCRHAAVGASGARGVGSWERGARGRFAAAASTGRELCTGTVDLAVVRGHACISYTITLTVASSDPYASLSAKASANISVQYFKFWTWSWSDWNEIGVGVGASVQLDPFKLCVSILGHDVCV